MYQMNNTDAQEVPPEFICPITRAVMEYPYTTTEGNSYEYGAITKWLRERSSDPLSNVTLHNKRVIPNNALRAQILAWFEKNPEAEATHRCTNVSKPPPPSRSAETVPCKEDSNLLNTLIRYQGKTDASSSKQQKSIPPAFTAEGHRYEYTILEKVLKVRCDGGAWVDALKEEMFVTPQGIVFYDPTETRKTRIFPCVESTKNCKFGSGCTNNTCSYQHPFICRDGVLCMSSKCKFAYHPEQCSVVPLGPCYPLNTQCKYGTGCTNKTCCFAHPRGRMSLPREKARISVTHSLTLEELAEPIPLPIEIPDSSTHFQFQGEFVFFFEPFDGSWAKNHYRKVIVHRFDPKKKIHAFLGEYSLAGHYCNCAVGSGRYLVISFWPYEEEAMRTIWECLKEARKAEKELTTKSKALDQKDEEIEKLKIEIQEKDAIIWHQSQQLAGLRRNLYAARKEAAEERKKAARAKQDAYNARREARELKDKWRRQRQLQEQRRNERLRMRDPIHIYALTSGTGSSKADWTLVLDYHKGAHGIKLGPVTKDSHQVLEITENNSVFQFELVVPKDVKRIRSLLPLVPGKLCTDF